MLDYRDLLKDNGVYQINSRQFNRIGIGNYQLSIQAARSYMCTPMESLIDLKDYTNMELAIFKDDELLQIDDDSLFDNWKYKKSLSDYLDDNVYANVPVEILQSLFEYLLSSQKLGEDEIRIVDITEGKVNKNFMKRYYDNLSKLDLFDE